MWLINCYMAEFIDDLLPIVRDIMAQLQKGFRESLQEQGHNLTGKLSESIDYEIENSGGNITAKMYIEDYGLSIEFGVPASRIPYGGGKGSGGTSKYIQGLIRFFELRGLSGRNAVGAAFATAKKHKKEGMPTRASSAYSSTGKRTGFIKAALDKEIPLIEEMMSQKFGAILEFKFKDAFSGYENITVSR